jgi:putative ABC transport system permease protein
MIRLFHFFRLAIQNLRRGGQRVLVALLCIAFGTMALVAMTLIAKSIEATVVLEPSQIVGGDLSMVRKSGDSILPAHVDQLKALLGSGEISRYTLIAFSSSAIMFRVPGSTDMHFVGNGMGIQPEVYPLAGPLTIGEPGSTGLPTLLRQVGDVVITRDIAQEYHLKVGGRLVLSDLRVGVPMEGTIRGIAYDTPNHQGDKIYFTIETAQKLAGGQPVVNTAIVITTHGKTAVAKLESAGWDVDWVTGRNDTQTANLWVIGLRGAGILGLLVGGIGIANTMQVLLRRRQHEIAVWKTLGYRESDLHLIFSFEAGLLGLVGSLLGAGLGILISGQVFELLMRTSSVLYEWKFSSTPPLMGVLVGTLTTVIFAFWAIVISSQARPMALLRNEQVDVRGLPGWQAAGLGLLLAAMFAVLTSLVMKSAAAGIGVLVCILAGIGVLSAFFSGLLWVCTRVLPLRGFPLARMAINSLQRRGFALIFAMIALFVGILSMSMGLEVAQISERRISGPALDFQGYNLNILAAAPQESAIRQAIQALNPEKEGTGYRTMLAGLSLVGDGEPLSAMDAVLVGRSDPEDYLISGASWGSQPDGVYAYKWANLKEGSRVEAAFRDGSTRIFTVAGSYDINLRSNNLYPPTGLLMSAEAFKRAAPADSLIYFVQVAPSQISLAAASLAASLPQATVVNLEAYAGRFMQSYQKLYVLPLVMAGLALLAGLLLVANSVSLAMLDRRYEIGILKTVGYTRGQILAIFAVEYGLVGLLSTAMGVFLIQGFLAVLVAANQMAAGLLLNPQSLAVIAFCGVGLTLLTACGVAWEPTRLSPLVVLNERN